MKVLLDTSVLVAALVKSHPEHLHARPWLRRARRGEIDLVVAAHSLAELYAALTAMPLRPRISPRTALRLIDENLGGVGEAVALTPAEYRAVLARAPELDVAGGAVYDALIAKVAEKTKVERLITLNVRDFRRVWPDGAGRIESA